MIKKKFASRKAWLGHTQHRNPKSPRQGTLKEESFKMQLLVVAHRYRVDTPARVLHNIHIMTLAAFYLASYGKMRLNDDTNVMTSSLRFFV